MKKRPPQRNMLPGKVQKTDKTDFSVLKSCYKAASFEDVGTMRKYFRQVQRKNTLYFNMKKKITYTRPHGEKMTCNRNHFIGNPTKLFCQF